MYSVTPQGELLRARRRRETFSLRIDARWRRPWVLAALCLVVLAALWHGIVRMGVLSERGEGLSAATVALSALLAFNTSLAEPSPEQGARALPWLNALFLAVAASGIVFVGVVLWDFAMATAALFDRLQ
ncbi:MAG: hypothetical protein NW203_09235 [Hyphomonadaceae bacterium]|nr:hypothetical protein [Hyphomonadaceae bacterium]